MHQLLRRGAAIALTTVLSLLGLAAQLQAQGADAGKSEAVKPDHDHDAHEDPDRKSVV